MAITTPAHDDRSADVENDPTLDALVPRPSPWRNRLIVGLVLVAVAVVWWSPAVLRPTIEPQGDGEAGTTYLSSSPFFLTYLPVEVDGWPDVDVRSVAGPAGLRVAGAWFVEDARFDQADGVARADIDDPLVTLSRLFPDLRLDAASALPQQVEPGSSAHLVVLFEVVDCGAVQTAATAIAPSIEVTLRTAVGTDVRRRFEGFGLVLDPELIALAEPCAAG